MKAWAQSTGRMLRLPGFAGLLAATFALGLGYAFAMPFLSLWGLQEVGFSPLQMGLFMTAASLSAIGVSMALARLSDTRLSRKVLLLVGSGGGALGYAGYAFIRDPVLLVLIGVTAIATASICFSQLFAVARDWFASSDPGERSIASSVVRVCFSFAWTAGPAVGAWVMAGYGFAGLFLGTAALYLIFGFGVWRCVPANLRPAGPAAGTGVPVWHTLRRPDLLGYFACFVLVFGAFSMNMMNLPIAVARELHGTTRDLGIIFGIGPLVEIPLMLWFGHLAGRGHQLTLIRLGGVSTALYFLLLCLAREPWHVYLIQILSGVSFAILANVAIVFFQDLVPGQAGLATTIFANAANLGNLVGYLGFGALATVFAPRGLFGAGAIAAVVACLMLLVLRPRRMACALDPGPILPDPAANNLERP